MLQPSVSGDDRPATGPAISSVPLSPIALALLAALAVLFGVACILPNIFQRLETAYPFRGIEMMGTDQEHYYAARIREVQDGFPMLGSVYYADGKHGPYIQPPLPEWIQAGIGSALGLDAARTVVLCKFLFGTALFAVAGLFFMRWTGRPWVALLAVSALFFAGFVFSVPGSIVDYLLPGRFGGGEFLRFSRPTNPQLSSFLFFLILLAVHQWSVRRSRRSIIIAGALTGAAFYVYPYVWSYVAFALAASFLLFLIRRDWRSVTDLLFLAVTAAIVAIPYGVHQWSIIGHPAYPAVLQRFVVLRTHAFVPGLWMLAFLLLAFIALFRPGPFRPLWLLTALAVAGLLSLEQQVLTGVMVLPQHYHWYFIQPLAVICWLLWLSAMVVPRLPSFLHTRRMLRALWGAGIILCLLLGFRFQQQSYGERRDEWGRLQSASGMLSFLSSHVSPGVVTYAPTYIRELVPIYTSGDAYDAANAFLCLCSDSRALDPYLFELWLTGVSPEEAARTLGTTRRAELSSRLHGLYYREAAGDFAALPESEVAAAVQAYRTFVALPLREKLTRHALRYLVFPVDRQPDTDAFRAVKGQSTIVYTDDAYVVFELRGS